MDLLRPVFWGQGMFLQPQHFQQQDWYHDARLRQFFHLFFPHCWGVKALTVNEPALQTFLFEVEQCEVVTWDGTILRFRGDLRPSNAKLEPRSFEQELDPGGKPLSVYLGLKRLQVEESNLRSPTNDTTNGDGAGGDHRRFFLAEAEAPDLYATGDPPSQLQYLVHEAHILFDVPTSRSQDYELIKIAEVTRSPDGKGGMLSKRYIPPAVTVRSDAVLETQVKEIRDLLTAKGQEIAQYRRRRGEQLAEVGTRDMGYLLMTQTLNRYIPLFHHYLEGGETHPYIMYGLLRQLVGELSSFSQTVSVLGMREGEEMLLPYRHDQLWPCFDLATRRVKELLNELTTTPIGDILLRYDGEFFTANLDQRFFTGDNRYYLAIKTDLKPSEMFALLQEVGKITSREEMPKIMHTFISGLTLEPLEAPPDELLMRAHYRYFAIDQRSPHWQQIHKRQNIAVYSTDSRRLPPETEMRLLVIYGE
ncbi:MAG: type VI secretion system baseplate subunit TssK [Candidatus Binatia bacterium]